MKSEATPLDWLRAFQRARKRVKAQRELQKITDSKRNSFECERYRRNREAQIKRRRVS